jgi:hypothetical protein
MNGKFFSSIVFSYPLVWWKAGWNTAGTELQGSDAHVVRPPLNRSYLGKRFARVNTSNAEVYLCINFKDMLSK